MFHEYENIFRLSYLFLIGATLFHIFPFTLADGTNVRHLSHLADAQVLLQTLTIQSKSARVSRPNLENSVTTSQVAELYSTKTKSCSSSSCKKVKGGNQVTNVTSNSNSSGNSRIAMRSIEGIDDVPSNITVDVPYADYHVKASRIYDAILRHEVNQLAKFREVEIRLDSGKKSSAHITNVAECTKILSASPTIIATGMDNTAICVEENQGDEVINRESIECKEVPIREIIEAEDSIKTMIGTCNSNFSMVPATPLNTIITPAVNDVTAPAVNDVTAPAVNDVTTSAVNDVTAPAVDDITAPAVNDITAPAVNDVTAPAVAVLFGNSLGDCLPEDVLFPSMLSQALEESSSNLDRERDESAAALKSNVESDLVADIKVILDQVVSEFDVRSAVAESDISAVTIACALKAEIEEEVAVIAEAKEDCELVIDQEIEKLQADIDAGYVVCLDLSYLKHECGLHPLDFSAFQCSPGLARREGEIDKTFPVSVSEMGNRVRVGEQQQVVLSSDMENRGSRQCSEDCYHWDTALPRESNNGGNTSHEGKEENSPQESNSKNSEERTPHSSTHRRKLTYVPWDRKVAFATIGSSYRTESQTVQTSNRVDQNVEKSNDVEKLEEKLESNLKLSKKRKKEKERDRKKEKMRKDMKSLTDDALEGPKKDPLHVEEQLLRQVRCVPPSPHGERSQYGMHMMLERYSFFDQICRHFQEDRERKKIVGKEKRIFTALSNIHPCPQSSCLLPYSSAHLL